MKLKCRELCLFLAVALVLSASVAAYLLFSASGSGAALGEAGKRAAYWQDYSNEMAKIAGIRGRIGDVHTHADFRVVIDGRQVDFFREEFNESNAFVHLHLDRPDDGGSVLHLEAPGVTLGHFFSSIGMRFASGCIGVDGVEKCADAEGGSQLIMFVNGRRNYELDNYAPANRDRILILYGNYSGGEIAAQLSLVTDYAGRYG